MDAFYIPTKKLTLFDRFDNMLHQEKIIHFNIF